jgi:hypothetical protein
MELFIMQASSASCHFLPLSHYKYFMFKVSYAIFITLKHNPL